VLTGHGREEFPGVMVMIFILIGLGLFMSLFMLLNSKVQFCAWGGVAVLKFELRALCSLGRSSIT
jgi:hypothetical protein